MLSSIHWFEHFGEVLYLDRLQWLDSLEGDVYAESIVVFQDTMRAEFALISFETFSTNDSSTDVAGPPLTSVEQTSTAVTTLLTCSNCHL